MGNLLTRHRARIWVFLGSVGFWNCWILRYAYAKTTRIRYLLRSLQGYVHHAVHRELYRCTFTWRKDATGSSLVRNWAAVNEEGRDLLDGFDFNPQRLFCRQILRIKVDNYQRDDHSPSYAIFSRARSLRGSNIASSRFWDLKYFVIAGNPTYHSFRWRKSSADMV